MFILVLASLLQAEIAKPWQNRLINLTKEERDIVSDGATERAFSGKYVNSDEKGIYRCKVCSAPLYSSDDKFHSGCGWPSFDDAISGAVKKRKDMDGARVEILCAKCGAHLGHVFEGEGFTSKNTRYCVNSLSLDFEKSKQSSDAKAYFAGGCFWGVEYYLEKLKGVKSVVSGYMGGNDKNPTYQEVSKGDTGHLESVEVVYDPRAISYEALAKIFFEIHDPTQADGQGPDVGKQYHSVVFVSNSMERKTIENLIKILENKGYKIATRVYDAKVFYDAEEYHQDYYQRHHKEPYCHTYIKRF